MYSALKHEGRPLYELARRGVEIAREAREVTVHKLDLVSWQPPIARVDMEVSKGFYVRSLAHDLGAKLGVGGSLAALRRTAVGRFLEADAVEIRIVEEAFAEGWWPRLLYPLDQALLALSAMVVDAGTEAILRNGGQFEGPHPAADTTPLVRVYDATGRFVGLVTWDPVTRMWQPDKVFPKPS
jgi:tRNA pseudouridine55 synthase